MTDEKKDVPAGDDKSCCSPKGSCNCCSGCRCGCRRGRCLLTVLAIAALGFGLFQAGRCSARHCAMPQTTAAPVVESVQK